MAASLSILVGPARSGKTYRLLSDYRRTLTSSPPGSALWLGPNRAAVETVQSALLGTDLPFCSRPQCHTFGRFAQAILDASPVPLRPASGLMKRTLLRQLIERGVAEGEIQHFRPIADTPGLLELVSSAIREWKRLEIWPHDLARACEQVGLSQKDAELLWLYEQYQSLLNQHDLYDNEGRFWIARAQLKQGQVRPFEHVRHVFIDGFSDFTRTEHEVLAILAERSQSMQISLPFDGQEAEATKPNRADLFAKPLRTLGELKRRHAHAKVEMVARREFPLGAINHIEANLFRTPARHLPTNVAAGVEIVAAAGHVQEFEGVARRIKELLTDDKHPIKPADILVVNRSLADAMPVIQEVFSRYGVPVALESRRRLGAATCVSSCIAWLKLEVEDWPFRQLLSVLSHNSLHPTWPEWEQGRAAVAAERLLREFQIPVGKAEVLRRIEHRNRLLAESPPPEPGSRAEHRSRWVRFASPLLAKLASATAQLPKTATAVQWSTALTQFANEIGIGRMIAEAPQEKEAWDTLMEQLRSLDRLNQWMQTTATKAKEVSVGTGRRQERDTGDVKINRSDLLDLLVEIAESESLPTLQDDQSYVRVVGASTARVLSVPFVFVTGLSEKSFPAAEREDRLYGEAEIAQLAATGLPLPTHSQRGQDEMLLFYELVTRATTKLVLSYPGLDNKAQPLAPSPYLSELERACGKGVIPHFREEELSPIPCGTAVLSVRDWRIRATADAHNDKRQLLAGLFSTKDFELRQQSGSLKRALLTLHARARGGFGVFEGMLTDTAATAGLTTRYGPQHCWSASQLERYAYCPYQYFASRVLGIEPLGELALEVDHLLRGNLLHGTLSDLHRRLNVEAGSPTSPVATSAQSFERAATEVLDALLQTLTSEEPLTQSLREIDRRLLSQWLLNYYEQHGQYDEQWKQLEGPFKPTYFEVPFGPEHRAIESEDVKVQADSLGTAEPLQIHAGGETVRIGGRIDRVDVGKIAGRTVFHVIDYKSASKFAITSDMVASGERLQLPLYALALEQLLLAEQGAVPWRASYWLVKEKGLKHRAFLEFHQLVDGQIEPTEAWLKLKQQLLERIVALVRGIRGGQFPMHCLDDTCTSRCDFRTVCRVGQVRSIGKTWQLDALPSDIASEHAVDSSKDSNAASAEAEPQDKKRKGRK